MKAIKLIVNVLLFSITINNVCAITNDQVEQFNAQLIENKLIPKLKDIATIEEIKKIVNKYKNQKKFDIEEIKEVKNTFNSQRREVLTGQAWDHNRPYELSEILDKLQKMPLNTILSIINKKTLFQSIVELCLEMNKATKSSWEKLKNHTKKNNYRPNYLAKNKKNKKLKRYIFNFLLEQQFRYLIIPSLTHLDVDLYLKFMTPTKNWFFGLGIDDKTLLKNPKDEEYRHATEEEVIRMLKWIDENINFTSLDISLFAIPIPLSMPESNKYSFGDILSKHNIKKLSIEGRYFYYLPEEKLGTLLRYYPNLKNITWDGIDLDKKSYEKKAFYLITDNNPQLESIDFLCSSLNESDFIIRGCSKLKNLKTLIIGIYLRSADCEKRKEEIKKALPNVTVTFDQWL